mmetsp:Transcript_6338/g.7127  ORF Transcript_6338/g.7127 Transcript_6338/m.7127 type:complete len:82 (-) Transcript_6338:82-327(-)
MNVSSLSLLSSICRPRLSWLYTSISPVNSIPWLDFIQEFVYSSGGSSIMELLLVIYVCKEYPTLLNKSLIFWGIAVIYSLV